jgi:hypothetical protein
MHAAKKPVRSLRVNIRASPVSAKIVMRRRPLTSEMHARNRGAHSRACFRALLSASVAQPHLAIHQSPPSLHPNICCGSKSSAEPTRLQRFREMPPNKRFKLPSPNRGSSIPPTHLSSMPERWSNGADTISSRESSGDEIAVTSLRVIGAGHGTHHRGGESRRTHTARIRKPVRLELESTCLRRT